MTTQSRRYALATLSGALLSAILGRIANEASSLAFENQNPNWFAASYPLWLLIALIVPGVVVALVARQRALACGLAAYAIGFLLDVGVRVLVWPSWLTTIAELPLAFLTELLEYTAIGGAIAHVSQVALRGWSSNNTLQRTRGGGLR